MQNIHTYYKQFQYLVQEQLQQGLAPVEKKLKVGSPRSPMKPSQQPVHH